MRTKLLSFIVSVLLPATVGAIIWPGITVIAQESASSAESDVETAVRDYYRYIKAYDHDAMRAAATPEFEIIYAGGRLDRAGFEAVHRAEELEKGPADSRPGRFDYDNTNFEIEINGDIAFSRSREMHPRDNNYYDYWVLRRDDDEWMIHRIFHMPMQGDAAP
jgi:hypothetical protein